MIYECAVTFQNRIIPPNVSLVVGSWMATLASFSLPVFRISDATNIKIINKKIYGRRTMNQETRSYPREHNISKNHVHATIKTIFTIKTIDVLATLQLTFPKQYECVFSILSNIIRNRDNTEITKKTNAGVHNDRTRVITSITKILVGIYIVSINYTDDKLLKYNIIQVRSVLRWVEMSGQEILPVLQGLVNR